MVFLDEVGFSLALYLLYGWAFRKERLIESVPLNRGKNQSVLGAFGKEGLVATASKQGAMKRVDVERFLEEDLLPLLPKNSVLVLDNAKIHKGSRIAEIVAKAGCSLLYLSPYSPDFSPIELAWSWIKQYVRRLCPRDDETRQEAVKNALATLPKGSTKAWFAKCGYTLN
jgi:transposase